MHKSLVFKSNFDRDAYVSHAIFKEGTAKKDGARLGCDRLIGPGALSIGTTVSLQNGRSSEPDWRAALAPWHPSPCAIA